MAGAQRGDGAPIAGTAAAAAIPGTKSAAASARTAIAAAAGDSTTTATDAPHAAGTDVRTDPVGTGDAAATAQSLAAAASSAAAAASISDDAANAADRSASTADDSKTTGDTATGGEGASGLTAASATAAAAAQAAAADGAPAAGLAITPAGAAARAIPIARALTSLVGAGGPDKHARGDLDGSRPADTSVAAADARQSGIDFDTSPTPILKVNAAVDTPEFGQGLADRVSAMVDNNLTSAKLQVNPPQLGPIEVRIAVQGDHALVWLTSHSAVTRDALESSSSKLRDMLGAQGFAQVSVDISQRNFQERPAPSQLHHNTPAADYIAPTVSGSAPSRARVSTGTLDAYA